MNTLAITFVALPVLCFAYAYAGYPLVLWLLARRRDALPGPTEPATWPSVTITLPVYNEAATIRHKLDDLLALDYPVDRRQILVISDASTDGTDDIAREYGDRGVELLRVEGRRGKTAAENAAAGIARGEIIVNTDAAVHLPPGALKALVRAFGDPTVGVASGRDVSTSVAATETNGGEQGYVGYEMAIRGLESRVGSIVGASGCFYGIRASIYDAAFPEALSRDFASALLAREHGYRAVSVNDAICQVPRTTGLEAEYRRKIRTMARGLETLWYKRHLLNPITHGAFAFMLFSHKLARWLVSLTLPLAAAGLAILAPAHAAARAVLMLGMVVLSIGWTALYWPAGRPLPRPVALTGFAMSANVAGVLAWLKVLRREHSPVWEPTRRTI